MVLFMDLPTEVRQQVLKYATFAYDAELNSIHIHSRFFDHDRDFFANRSDFEAACRLIRALLFTNRVLRVEARDIVKRRIQTLEDGLESVNSNQQCEKVIQTTIFGYSLDENYSGGGDVMWKTCGKTADELVRHFGVLFQLVELKKLLDDPDASCRPFVYERSSWYSSVRQGAHGVEGQD